MLGKWTQVNSSLYRVKLFDDPFESTTLENVEKLWAFRKALRIDDVAE